jgi:hypothetical protein
MAEVVRQMVALGFQRIIVFVLHLPAGTPVPYDVGDVRFGNPVISGEGVFIDDLAILRGDEFGL